MENQPWCQARDGPRMDVLGKSVPARHGQALSEARLQQGKFP